MKKIKKILLAIVSMVLVAIPTCNGFAFADTTSVMMIVSPPVQRIILAPGETYSGMVDVSAANGNTMDVKYSAGVSPFNLSQVENGYKYENDFTKETDYNQMVDWITIEDPSGIVSPNDTKRIHYKIEVPLDAPAGSQYAAITVRNGNDEINTDSGEGATITSIYQIASIILAQVAGDTVESGGITENIVPAFVLDGSAFKTESFVENTGNVHTDAEYTLQVWPLFSGEEICTNEENPDSDLVLPGMKKYYTQSCSLPAFGIFNVKQTVKIFDQTSTVERMVIVCPMWLLFIIIFLIALGIIYLVAKSKKRKEN